jgi:hypothetical protein
MPPRMMTAHPDPGIVVSQQVHAGRSTMQSRRYTVTVEGRLGERFRATFPGVSIKPGHGHTRLLTEPFDQGQLHGLLNRVRDFGFDLLAVEVTPTVADQLGDRAPDSR